MSTLEQLLAATYPNTYEPPSRYDAPPVDAGEAEARDWLAQQVAATTAQQIHDLETQHHRPLQPHERDEIAARVQAQYDEAAAHADRVTSHYEEDFAQQIPRLERELGRPLLADERESIHQRGFEALNTRGETLNARQAYDDHWADVKRNAPAGGRGSEPPNMNSPAQEDRHMANVMRERLQEARAADGIQQAIEPPAPAIEYVDETSSNAHMHNTHIQEARMYELQGRPVPPRLQQYATQPPAHAGDEREAA